MTGLTQTPDSVAETTSVDTPAIVVPPDSTAHSPRDGRSLVRRLTGATIFYGIGQSIDRVVRFLLIPVFTLVMTPEDYGILEMAGAVSAFLVIVMRLGVPGAVTRFYFDHHEGPALRDYVTTVWLFVVGCSLACAALAVGVSWVFPEVWQWISPGLGLWPYGAVVIATATIVAGQNLQDRLVQAREQASYAARLNLARGAISIAMALIFVVALRWGALGMLLSELVVTTLFCLQAIRYLRPELAGSFRLSMLWTSLVYAVGILPSHFIGNVAPLITRSWLAHVDSLAAVGLLGLANRFSQPLTILGFAFTNAYNPIYFSVRKNSGEGGLVRLADTARNVWAFATWLTLAACTLGPATIVLVTDSRYHAAGPILPILALSFPAQAAYTLLGPEIFYSKRTWLMPLISAGTAAATIGITIATAASWGAEGMAWAIVGGSVVQAILATIFSCSMVSIPHHWFSLLRIAACGLAAWSIMWFSPAATTLSGAAWQLVYAVLACAAYPALLLATGDPSIREAWGIVGRRLRRNVLD